MRKIYIVGALAVLFSACKPNVAITTKPSPGTANFANYLAIGSSYTAGFSDNALTVSGQYNSYPIRLFEQFSLVGSDGPFIQPYVYSDNGYANPKLVLSHKTYCNGDYRLAPIDVPNWNADSRDSPFVSTANNGQINNIGIPRIRAVDYMVAGFPLINRWASRFYNNAANPATRPLDELSFRVRTQHPTFVTMWLGIDDVLGFALAGGQGDGTGAALPVAGNIYNSHDISNFNAFFNAYDSALNTAVSTSADGALINIPDILSLPFFNVIPVKGLNLTRRSLVDSLNAKYPSATREKAFDTGYNYFIVRDHNGNVRQAVPGELILMTTPVDSILCASWGGWNPIPEEYVITTEEQQQIQTAISTFNGHIFNRAQLFNLAYVDMHNYLTSFPSGFSYNGIKYSTDFVSGGTISLDGIHPTQRGYALIANKIIMAINDHYKATIPQTDVNKYRGITFP
ncbi:MAG: hypothetical protein V4649_00685 [Bacteroidota bacterium]